MEVEREDTERRKPAFFCPSPNVFGQQFFVDFDWSLIFPHSVRHMISLDLSFLFFGISSDI